MSTTTYKILSQSSPGAAANATFYTAPSTVGLASVFSTINAANKSAVADAIRVWVVPAADVGGGVQDKHIVLYDAPVEGNSALPIQLGVTLAPSDIVVVYSLNGTTKFSGFGFTYLP